MTAQEIVEEFIAVMNRLDWDAVYALMADDIVYHNIPFPPLEGLDAVKGFFGAVGVITDCDWKMISIASSGDLVLTERLDNFRLDGAEVSLPVMGVFRIRDAKIAEWRDYFDRAMFEEQLGRSLA